MSDDAMSDNAIELRIETLELKLMDLDNTVQQLNEVILRQYRDIERLQMQHTELLNRMSQAPDSTPVTTAADEVPPHY